MKEYIEQRIKELHEAKQKHMTDAMNSQANANGCEGAIIELTATLKKIEDENSETTS